MNLLFTMCAALISEKEISNIELDFLKFISEIIAIM